MGLGMLQYIQKLNTHIKRAKSADSAHMLVSRVMGVEHKLCKCARTLAA